VERPPFFGGHAGGVPTIILSKAAGHAVGMPTIRQEEDGGDAAIHQPTRAQPHDQDI
jgi:hypothetical protein